MAIILTPDALEIPPEWDVLAGADTGTYMSGVIAAIPPIDEPPIYVLYEAPNYHYVGGQIELLGITVREWIHAFGERLKHLSRSETTFAWVDRNTTFISEIGEGLAFERNFVHLELRTEITREYFQQGRIFLAPWLQILPYEIEHASWPESGTMRAGRYTRKKDKDHTLDCLEHICSRRPLSSHHKGQETPRFLDQYLQQHGHRPQMKTDPHLGDA
mgnify:FL=1